jgi:hypothetical protein
MRTEVLGQHQAWLQANAPPFRCCIAAFASERVLVDKSPSHHPNAQEVGFWEICRRQSLGFHQSRRANRNRGSRDSGGEPRGLRSRRQRCPKSPFTYQRAPVSICIGVRLVQDISYRQKCYVSVGLSATIESWGTAQTALATLPKNPTCNPLPKRLICGIPKVRIVTARNQLVVGRRRHLPQEGCARFLVDSVVPTA